MPLTDFTEIKAGSVVKANLDKIDVLAFKNSDITELIGCNATVVHVEPSNQIVTLDKPIAGIRYWNILRLKPEIDLQALWNAAEKEGYQEELRSQRV